MDTNDHVVDTKSAGNLEVNGVYEGVSISGQEMQEIENATKVIARIDLGIAYSSEKLANLHVLLMHLLSWELDFEVMAAENGCITATTIEKALVFDFLSSILDSEVREVESFMDMLQAEIVDARCKTCSCRHIKEISMTEEKLSYSEESLKQSQNRISEMKMQLVELQMAFSPFRHEKWKKDQAIDSFGNGELSNVGANSESKTAEQLRHFLRMLEKSLAREQDLEKKLSELRQNEEQLNLKLHYTEQVALLMEEASEVVWGRFLESDNLGEVLMGISKNLVGQNQIIQFNLNGAIQRETESKARLKDCMEQLKSKETTVGKLENRITEYIVQNSEVVTLRKRVKLLEEQLKKSEINLTNACASNEESQEQLCEMGNIIETLKESIYEAESRAESAETKVTQLTDTNLELTEEINFLKGSDDSNVKKVSLLEKQLRESEIQLQQAKASSEASQEQQNMLYSAIWDMETLIEDLKSKVSKGESAEERCVTLSKSNSGLNKELSFLNARMECLQTSLDQANNTMVASAKVIDLRSRLITDTIMQLSTERKRIQKQLYALARENKILVEKLSNSNNTLLSKGGDANEKHQHSENDSMGAACTLESF
ncbi:hypothetical protein HS088_TW22G01485 [Tripterygium wilfordii]|uniref:WIT1/2 N-terminal helical bundle domain-containing protein n=1 Tax=Tripterygium wilfordii TaxID=458696 RepID=A0A7J7C108_TRIWF|nr:WPP domain-interacting tail-anchored protein 2 [Tripterygium wilfordii]XP_038694285.1 WPP domain-interacting tail-anchored protein 2 [Tripterygium wilfordii]XP_038694286.1 WPP domain-interacting tail-anchored protein 2 [Tripterygium wilfordii]XP_038694287.1 WPP domain-interacting tail-anchored protein 2 [Tripterygium wilfordii]KAF5727788.1 hypothetical protein HS088_TW22G01485 [Tripterygium wilfordii]